MLPTYKIYLDDWYQDTEVYGKVINWDDVRKLDNLYAYPHVRVPHHFTFVVLHPEDHVLFPYFEPETHLHKYNHIPELTSDQLNQLIFIHSLDQ